MCKIVYIKNSEKLSKEKLEQYYIFNNDGIGIAYKNNSKVNVVKFLKFEDFYDFYKKIEYSKCIIHFRAATAGTVNVLNTHPFLVSRNIRRLLSFWNLKEKEMFVLEQDEFLMFHNGHLTSIAKVYDDITKTLNVDFLEKLKIDKNIVSDTFLASLSISLLYMFEKDIKKAIKTVLSNEKYDRIIIIDNNFNVIYSSGYWIKLSKNVVVSNGLGDYYHYYDYYLKHRKKRTKNNKKRKKRFSDWLFWFG